MTLLDTQALVWLAEGCNDLGERARRAADEALASEQLAVSAMSFWEAAMLHEHACLRFEIPVETWRSQFLDQGLLELPVTGQIGIAAAVLRDFHGDPADRIITATAQAAGATLITADRRILQWPGTVLRLDARR